MAVHSTLHTVRERAASLPAIRHWLEARYAREFFAHSALTHNMYRGVFETFAQAQASIAQTRPSGYDNTPSAELYRERTRRVYINDYPAMLWFSKLFEAGCTSVFDLGGHIGIAYYAYQRYVTFPEEIAWRVLDVPAVNVAGAAWASQHDNLGRLTFTAHRDDADGVDIFFAAGSLQYLDYTLADLLGGLQTLPRYLLLNSVPIHPSASYFTVQNMGTACCPYRITSERDFLHGLKALGYVLRDRWENPHRSCVIPFHDDRSLDRYFGFCFERET
ncbi:putative methyltransferase (TIGR04325 family) [Luteibacter rhizovicinus]|uniref:Putative methyltransferase (TIGR04325 family) n=1 Tax=Luteibacter rhizovicinus TaxID=242606 RepID=A0A4V2W3U2_9GAMM|nr:TIGR04325 family methyltransferase [Luteibacter rhizovicinus]TCV93339.1 putative methyltransferase (TIGR04325 family) [Luteibacter rhizovicinus]